LVFEVTVTVTAHTTPTGVPVMVKLLLADVEDLVSVKKYAVVPSGATFTSIVTPCGGIVDVIETVSGKSVPGAAGCVMLAAGFSVTARLASVLPPPPPPPPPLLPQVAMPNMIARDTNDCNKILFINPI